jgi:TonB family protein
MLRDETMKTICTKWVAVILLGTIHPSCSARGQESTQGAGASTTPSQFISPGYIIKKVQPVYPKEAKLRGVQGIVVMSGTIAADGTVKDIKIVSGDLILRQAAVDAVSQWRYAPYRVEGVAVDVKSNISVIFSLGLGGAQYDMGQASQRDNPVNSGATQAQTLLPGGTLVTIPSPPAGVMRVSGRVMAGQLQKKVDPVYPADAVAVDARGDVVLLVTIKKTGEVGEVQAVSGPYRFRDAAIDAVKQWQYRPYEVDGTAVEVQVIITMNFAPPQAGKGN